MSQTAAFDFIVIGAGIAGASVAAELSNSARVALIERESQPGYHTTGRSAALYTRAYGPAVMRAMTRASFGFYSGGADPDMPQDLLQPRGVLLIARADQRDALATMHRDLGDAVVPASFDDLKAQVPLIRDDYAIGGLYEADAYDIDVHGTHQYFLRQFRANGGQTILQADVTGLSRENGTWAVDSRQGQVKAATVINAAGAWADQIAELAGVSPLGLRPLRRTAALIAPPAGVNVDDWPLVVDAEEGFYMKPDAGNLLISPADETLSPPCDAQPEELDIAICVDRIEKAINLQVRRIDHKWAGLRSFFPDKLPAVGYDANAEGFFWLAGQGGYGIQTAPAMARSAAALAMRQDLPQDVRDEGVTADQVSPNRLRI
ncbi:NAD(P)/FAD-dependent oxidoreductase [Phaeobacter marinintestinus]|uniref:NAD(P)/FAD-dependent oxidoreductase n=1 Tax=Falsiphaeobacter marinintestinus TaxID=1492905 RepID=UPI0011B502F8|nr:FAD-dependent oxidoreductase [Phaeobacter marinintestinus]